MSQAKLVELKNKADKIKWAVIGICRVRRQGKELIDLNSGNIQHCQGIKQVVTV